MTSDPAIDTSGRTPRLVLGALLTTSVGTLLLAQFKAVMSWIRGVGDGVSDVINGVSTFLYSTSERSVLSLTIGGVESTMAAAWDANAVWLASTFGTFAQPVAVVEIVVVIWLMYAAIGAGYRKIRAGVA